MMKSVQNSVDTFANLLEWVDVIDHTRTKLHKIMISQSKYDYDMIREEDMIIFFKHLTKIVT